MNIFQERNIVMDFFVTKPSHKIKIIFLCDFNSSALMNIFFAMYAILTEQFYASNDHMRLLAMM